MTDDEDELEDEELEEEESGVPEHAPVSHSRHPKFVAHRQVFPTATHGTPVPACP